MSTRLGMAERARRIEGDPVVACTLGVQPGRGLGCVRAERGPAPTPSPPPCTDCGRWLHAIRYMSIHVILACMNRAVRAVLSLDATAWRSPALCVRLESAAMMSYEILFLYPLLLDPCPRFAIMCVCVSLSLSARRVCELPVICPIALAHATPTPFAINATCPRYLAVRSELEHCEPLPLRVPLARSRPHPRPSAIRLVIKRFSS